MELKPHVGSDKAFVYHVAADFADEVAKPELLAVRFGTTESTCIDSFLLHEWCLISLVADAQKFKAEFDAAKENNAKLQAAGAASTPAPAATDAPATDSSEPAEKKD